MNFLASYKNWLKNKDYNKNTVRNYLADTKKYLNFIVELSQKDTSSNSFNQSLLSDIASDPKTLFSTNLIDTYISQITDQKNSSRYLASLSLFCQFAIDQNLISANPVKKILKQQKRNLNSPRNIEVEDLLSQYETFLLKRNKSQSTIKNYINDIQQFINWSQNT